MVRIDSAAKKSMSAFNDSQQMTQHEERQPFFRACSLVAKKQASNAPNKQVNLQFFIAPLSLNKCFLQFIPYQQLLMTAVRVNSIQYYFLEQTTLNCQQTCKSTLFTLVVVAKKCTVIASGCSIFLAKCPFFPLFLVLAPKCCCFFVFGTLIATN